MSRFAQLPAYCCSTARAFCTHFKYIRGQMRRTTLNVETLAHTGSQVGPNIQHGGSRPVVTNVQRESSILMSPQAVGGTSAHHGSEVGSSFRSRVSITPQIDDVAADDDLIMSSAREFEQARRKNNLRRIRRRTLDSEGQSTGSSPKNRSKRKRGPSNLEIENAWSAQHKKFEFTCPVCLGPIVQEMSTKCGHVFCKECISQSIATQGRCPVCRTKISMKDSIKIYLPMAS
ncbi:uncharacterized protein LOC141717094 [Apium graveolens]|uniref:uncharacterized protein LOC141717094 n=1 Tax=Apium graveolens TaxID=4045 RepID=UPI003D79DC8E